MGSIGVKKGKKDKAAVSQDASIGAGGSTVRHISWSGRKQHILTAKGAPLVVSIVSMSICLAITLSHTTSSRGSGGSKHRVWFLSVPYTNCTDRNRSWVRGTPRNKFAILRQSSSYTRKIIVRVAYRMEEALGLFVSE